VGFVALGIAVVLNLQDLDLVGKTLVIFGACVILPFLVIVVEAVPLVPAGYEVMLQSTPRIDYAVLLSTVIWNNSGYDICSVSAGDIDDVQHTLLPAMGLTCFLVAIQYMVPMALGAVVDPNFSHWENGYFTEVGAMAVGEWFRGVMALGGVCASMGLMNSRLRFAAQNLASMAQLGLLPAAVGKTLESGAPIVAVFAYASGVVALVVMDFDLAILFEVCAVICCGMIIAEIFLFLMLREVAPDLDRPFRIPFGTAGTALVLLPAVVVSAVGVALNRVEAVAALGVVVAAAAAAHMMLAAVKLAVPVMFVDPERDARAWEPCPTVELKEQRMDV